MRQTADGGYIVAGFTTSSDGDVPANQGVADAWAIKLDASGNIVWRSSFGGSSNDYAYAIEQSEDGGYIVVGVTASNDGDVTGNHGGFDQWVVKLNASCALEWQKTYGGSLNDLASAMTMTTDGGVVLAGYALSDDGDVSGNHGGSDAWVIKVNSARVLQWQRSLGGRARIWLDR